MMSIASRLLIGGKANVSKRPFACSKNRQRILREKACFNVFPGLSRI
jgi:hypothetical protein